MPPPCANAIGVARWNQPVRRLIPAHGGPIPGPDQGIPRRIDVSVVRRTTVATYPESFNQPIDPSRTCQGSARKTGDGGVSFIDDFERPGRLPALVFQEVLEHPQPESNTDFAIRVFTSLRLLTSPTAMY